MSVTGRDVDEQDKIICFDKQSCQWNMKGNADWLAEQRARLQYDGNPIVKTIKKLLEQSPDGRWDGTIKELMEAGKYIAGTWLAPTAQKLGHDVKALDRPLFDYDGILHTRLSNGTGGGKHSFHFQNVASFRDLSEQEQAKIPFT